MFLYNVDFAKNQILNAVFQVLASDPSSPVQGQFYFNSTSGRPRWYHSGDWFEPGAGGGGLTNAYTSFSDGTNTAASSGATAFKLRTASNLLSIVVEDNNGTHGDNALFTINQANFSFTASQVSDFNTAVRTNRLDQMAAPTASVSLNSQKITGLADPTSAQEAATKNYVDLAIQGLDGKDAVQAATTANITIATPGDTFDGITLTNSGVDRLLVKNQTTQSENGIYIWNGAASPLTRAPDSNAWAELVQAYVFVEKGTTLADTGWLSTVDQGGTLGTTAVTFTQFSAAGQITANNQTSGSGIGVFRSKSGTTLNFRSLLAADNSIELALDDPDTDILISVVPGNIGINALAGTLGLAKGGTNADASTTAGKKTARDNLVAAGVYTATYGDGAALSYTFTQATHGLAAVNKMTVAVYDVASGDQVMPKISVNNSNGTVTLTHAVAPTSNQYRVVIQG
jgi:hypothetical protein